MKNPPKIPTDPKSLFLHFQKLALRSIKEVRNAGYHPNISSADAAQAALAAYYEFGTLVPYAYQAMYETIANSCSPIDTPRKKEIGGHVTSTRSILEHLSRGHKRKPFPLRTIKDIIEDPWAKEKVRKALSSLSYRERQVLDLRLNDVSLEAVGQTLGISRERVRQIEEAAKKRLSHPAFGLEYVTIKNPLIKKRKKSFTKTSSKIQRPLTHKQDCSFSISWSEY